MSSADLILIRTATSVQFSCMQWSGLPAHICLQQMEWASRVLKHLHQTAQYTDSSFPLYVCLPFLRSLITPVRTISGVMTVTEDPYLSPCTKKKKPNYKGIEDLTTVKPERLKLQEGNRGSARRDRCRKGFSEQNLFAHELRLTTDKLDLVKLKSFCTVKETVE